MKQPIHRQITFGIVLLLLSFAAPAIGFKWPPGEWYAAINKPSWNPPGWVFGPVWTTLYLLMATAAWLVWKREGWKKPMNAWLVQLILNAAWTPLFFGAKRIDVACSCIIALWFAILVTILYFWRVNKVAAWLMAPYLAWVTFASVLNATLWAMNR